MGVADTWRVGCNLEEKPEPGQSGTRHLKWVVFGKVGLILSCFQIHTHFNHIITQAQTASVSTAASSPS